VSSVSAVAGAFFAVGGDEPQVAGELLLLAAVSSLGVVGGVMLRVGRAGARPLLLAMAALNAIAVPVGTLLAGYTVWVLVVRRSG
jgi:uncharacterized protein (TIGR04206 family)